MHKDWSTCAWHQTWVLVWNHLVYAVSSKPSSKIVHSLIWIGIIFLEGVLLLCLGFQSGIGWEQKHGVDKVCLPCQELKYTERLGIQLFVLYEYEESQALLKALCISFPFYHTHLVGNPVRNSTSYLWWLVSSCTSLYLTSFSKNFFLCSVLCKTEFFLLRIK